jgi:hypothetical protein
MQDVFLWFGSGAVALVQLLLWNCVMPRARAYTPPSEHAGVIFFVMLLGPVSLFVVSFGSVMAILLLSLWAAGALIDWLFEKD